MLSARKQNEIKNLVGHLDNQFNAVRQSKMYNDPIIEENEQDDEDDLYYSDSDYSDRTSGRQDRADNLTELMPKKQKRQNEPFATKKERVKGSRSSGSRTSRSATGKLPKGMRKDDLLNIIYDKLYDNKVNYSESLMKKKTIVELLDIAKKLNIDVNKINDVREEWAKRNSGSVQNDPQSRPPIMEVPKLDISSIVNDSRGQEVTVETIKINKSDKLKEFYIRIILE